MSLLFECDGRTPAVKARETTFNSLRQHWVGC